MNMVKRQLFSSLFSIKIRPIFKLFQIYGQVNFTVTKSGEVKKSKSMFIYSLIVSIVIGFVKMLHTFHHKEMSFIANTYLVLIDFTFIVSTINAFAKADQQMVLIRDFNDVDKLFYINFDHKLCSICYQRYLWKCLIHIILIFVNATITVVQSWIRSRKLIFAAICFPLQVIAIQTWIGMFYIEHVILRLDTLIEFFKKMLLKPKIFCELNGVSLAESFDSYDNKYTILFNIRKIYTKLVTITDLINDCFGLLFLSAMIHECFLLPTIFYWLYSTFCQKQLSIQTILCKLRSLQFIHVTK